MRICREPDKLRIFINYALKTPEYECLSNFSPITYYCHFSAYARVFVLFRIYGSCSGDAEFGVPGHGKPSPDANNSLLRIPADTYFFRLDFCKISVSVGVKSCKAAMRLSYLE